MNTQRRKTKQTLVLVSLLGIGMTTYAGSTNGSFILVDGATQAVIVGNPVVPAAVQNGYYQGPPPLPYYIEESSGRKLRVVREAEYDPVTMPYAIFLGDTQRAKKEFGAQLAKLDPDSYVVAVEEHAVILAGARPYSAGYAQFDFLENCLGIATYIPTKWGTIVPKHERIVLPVDTRIESPVFDSRAFSALRTWRDDGKINYSANTEIPWRIYRRDSFSHNLHTFITVQEFGKTHPEYFPEINGKRVIVSSGTGPGPAISNPDVVKIITQKVLAYFDDPKNAGKDMISLGMTDGGWCECDQCKAMDGPDINGNLKSKSTRYYKFLNQVAKALEQTHPGKFIGVPAYAGADWPPKDLAIEPNIAVYICQTRANWGDPAVREEQLRQLQAWTSRVNKVGAYEYLYGAGFMVPRLYSGYLADYLRAVQRETKARGFYAEMYSNHALDGPKAWITEKLIWNPQQDPTRLLHTWCQAVFNEAAAPMQQYFQFLEDCNSHNILRCPVGPKSRDSKFYLLQNEGQFALFNPEEIEHAESFLAAAQHLTKRPEIAERIQYFTDGIKVTEESVRAYYAYANAKAVAATNAPPEKILAALIDGDAHGPDADPLELMHDMNAKDPGAFTDIMPVAITTATELSVRLINGTPWSTVHNAIQHGERDRGKLVALAQAEVRKFVPPDAEKTEFGRKRVAMLLDMASRIAVAHKVSTPPTLDGVADDAVWQWQDDTPWWSHGSGLAFTNQTQFAFCHDGNTLYVAFRGHLAGLNNMKKCEGYGAAAWKYVSAEFFLNPDERDAKAADIPFFQFVPALGGGLYCSTPDVVKSWKVTNTDDLWQAELAIDLTKIHMTPDRFPALRLNVQNNVSSDGHHSKGWFPAYAAHKDYESRGWLVFEP